MEPLKTALAAYCRRSLYRRDDVQDVIQSAIATAYRDFHLYAEGTNFRAWIFRMVGNEVLNRNRQTAQRREVDLTEDLPARSVVPGTLAGGAWDEFLDDPEGVLDECDAGMSRCLHDLSDRERNVFLLRAVGDFKYREIAEILDVPIGTVMGLLSRARQRLRQGLLGYAIEHRMLPRSSDTPITEPN